jgi:uncharacterized protein (TIGR02284 family)
MSPGYTTSVKIVFDLVQLHIDRVATYGQAIHDLAQSSPDLKNIFGGIVRQAALYEEELTDGISQFDGNPADHLHKRRGNVYSSWARVKSPIGGKDHKSVLDSCKTELESVQHAYITALSMAEPMEPMIRRLIESQLYGIKSIQDSIEQYHDAL